MKKIAIFLLVFFIAAAVFASNLTNPKTLSKKSGTIGTWSSGVVSFTLKNSGDWIPGENGSDFSSSKKISEESSDKGFEEGFVYMNSAKTKVYATTESYENKTRGEIDKIVNEKGTPYFEMVDTKDLYGISLVYDQGDRTFSGIYIMTRNDESVYFIQAGVDYNGSHVSEVSQSVEKNLKGIIGGSGNKYLMYMYSTASSPKFEVSHWHN